MEGKNIILMKKGQYSTFFIFSLLVFGLFNNTTSIFAQIWQPGVYDSLKRAECDAIFSNIQENNNHKLNKVKGKPNDFQEALVYMDSMMTEGLKDWVRCLPDGEFGLQVHHGFGTQIRNKWELWGNSKLAQNMYLMGVFHPDDMSSIILDSYQLKLKGEYIRLEEQLKYYQDHWRRHGVKVDSLLRAIKKQNKKLAKKERKAKRK